ncbi:arginine synthesis PII-interacting regulator PirA [Planktothrix tepida]|uniref:arginine synthesis PII-interacting regulator PirA n=1 Tax=Planktothrix TaxID=54304 RepID=UPI003F584AE7
MNKNSRRNSVKLSDVHRANIQKRLEHRLEVARTNGDENLIRLLEAEMRQI